MCQTTSSALQYLVAGPLRCSRVAELASDCEWKNDNGSIVTQSGQPDAQRVGYNNFPTSSYQPAIRGLAGQ